MAADLLVFCSPCGIKLLTMTDPKDIGNFYSRIPCGMEPHEKFRNLRQQSFQLTHPVWDGTTITMLCLIVTAISTHTSRMGWNPMSIGCFGQSKYFNSRIPCGMEPHEKFRNLRQQSFQLTHPVRDGTRKHGDRLSSIIFSTHTSRVGWNQIKHGEPLSSDYFNSHNPCGMERANEIVVLGPSQFQLTHPVWDGTTSITKSISYVEISTHTSRVGWNKMHKDWSCEIGNFNSRIPCGMEP